MTSSEGRDEPDVAMRFEHDSTAPRDGRRAIAEVFSSEGSLANDVALVASELVANVILHTEDGGNLTAWNRGRIRIEVSDDDDGGPIQRMPDDSGGRGLRIVDEIADDWGVERSADRPGKTVWAEFDRRETDS